jgi:hypothetical protein
MDGIFTETNHPAEGFAYFLLLGSHCKGDSSTMDCFQSLRPLHQIPDRVQLPPEILAPVLSASMMTGQSGRWAPMTSS